MLVFIFRYPVVTWSRDLERKNLNSCAKVQRIFDICKRKGIFVRFFLVGSRWSFAVSTDETIVRLALSIVYLSCIYRIYVLI